MSPSFHAAALLVLLGSATAPLQCASDPPAATSREETPGEALKRLADEFAKAGDSEARVKTLQFLVERYPRSRFAEEAKVELEQLGVDVDAKASASANASASASANASASASASASATTSASAGP